MAETSPPPVSSGGPPESESLQHYCYQCEKRVSIETQTDEQSEIICYECKGGFVVNRPPSPPPLTSSHSHSHHHHHRILHEPSLSHHFLQVLRLVAQAAREDDDDAPPPPPPPTDPLLDPSGSDDYLRIELDGWGANGEEEEDEDEEDRIAFFRNNNIDSESSDHDAAIVVGGGGVGGGAEVMYDDDDDDEDEEVDQYRHRERIRLQLRDMAARAASGRNRILDLDWAEILTGLEDNAIELRVEMSESDGYIGNPEDYVDEAGYEALLQNLAESDGGGIRGPPPASKSAVSNLPTVEITPEEEGLVCAICKDSMPVGETAKKLPCGHGYHGDCIIPWLGSRNSCPVCRFELPTEDPEYEEEKKKKNNNKRSSTSAASSIPGSASAPSSSGGE